MLQNSSWKHAQFQGNCIFPGFRIVTLAARCLLSSLLQFLVTYTKLLCLQNEVQANFWLMLHRLFFLEGGRLYILIIYSIHYYLQISFISLCLILIAGVQEQKGYLVVRLTLLTECVCSLHHLWLTLADASITALLSAKLEWVNAFGCSVTLSSPGFGSGWMQTCTTWTLAWQSVGVTKGQSVFHSVLTKKKKKCISLGQIVVELWWKDITLWHFKWQLLTVLFGRIKLIFFWDRTKTRLEIWTLITR